MLFFLLGSAMTIKLWMCKFYCRELSLSLHRLLINELIQGKVKSADDWSMSLEFCGKPSILEADDFLGACCRKAMTPQKLWTFSPQSRDLCDSTAVMPCRGQHWHAMTPMCPPVCQRLSGHYSRNWSEYVNVIGVIEWGVFGRGGFQIADLSSNPTSQ